VIVGAGAAGLIAALSAKELGAEPLVIERDRVAQGSTALSAGLIPAAGTRWQKAAGILDSPAAFAADVMAKAQDEPDAAEVTLVTEEAGRTLEWLADRHGFGFELVENFNYPGHSARRMHGLPTRSGAELIDRLRSAAEGQGIDILAQARARDLAVDTTGEPIGLTVERPDGAGEQVGFEVLVLACNGYGGNPDLVRRHIPSLADALYFGHAGNQGDAVLWGEAMGARLRHLSGHQGHGSVAQPHGILISWATIMEGGFQVNSRGDRFSDESVGYSEQAAIVLAQPEGIAWTIFDERIAGVARQFRDFRDAEGAGAILSAPTPGALAQRIGVPADRFLTSFAAVSEKALAGGRDAFGRCFEQGQALAPPLHAVRVTGALFHTQGGLAIDNRTRVLRADGGVFPRLFACGGAACGVSGGSASGYLSGNGLLSAVALGRVAGREAAGLLKG
jgi:fumarate reductase flavoprotein subunit